MTGVRVLFLDDDDDLREVMTDLLSALRHDTLGARSLDELREHDGRVLDCQLAILDINLGAGVPSGVDAYRWLRERGLVSPVVFLTGHGRSSPLLAETLRLGPEVRILEKPVSLAQLQALLGEVKG